MAVTLDHDRAEEAFDRRGRQPCARASLFVTIRQQCPGDAREGETLQVLLKRLDKAIGLAWSDDLFIDEVNHCESAANEARFAGRTMLTSEATSARSRNPQAAWA